MVMFCETLYMIISHGWILNWNMYLFSTVSWNNKVLLVSRFIIANFICISGILCVLVSSLLFSFHRCYMWEILMCEEGWWFSLNSSAHCCFLTLRFMACNLTVLTFYTILENFGTTLWDSLCNDDLLISGLLGELC
jgi:hypothetical protein